MNRFNGHATLEEMLKTDERQRPRKSNNGRMRQDQHKEQHLTEEELTALLADGTIPEQRRQHLEACEVCQEALEKSRAAMAKCRALINTEIQRVDTTRIGAAVKAALRSRRTR